MLPPSAIRCERLCRRCMILRGRFACFTLSSRVKPWACLDGVAAEMVVDLGSIKVALWADGRHSSTMRAVSG